MVFITWLFARSLRYKFKSAWFGYFVRLLGFTVLTVAISIGILSSSEDLKSRVFAQLFVQMSKSKALDNYRCGLLSEIRGRVLEIGPGPGTNLRCWKNNPNIIEWVGIDSNKYFENPLEKERASLNISFPMSMIWRSGSGDNLSLVPESFDVVVATHLLCSVSDMEGIFSTISRVLKPSGSYYMLEHVAAENGTVLRYLQLLFEPLFTVIGNGCKFRQTAVSLNRSKEKGGEFYSYQFNITELMAPIELPFLQPHIYGTITKPGTSSA